MRLRSANLMLVVDGRSSSSPLPCLSTVRVAVRSGPGPPSPSLLRLGFGVSLRGPCFDSFRPPPPPHPPFAEKKLWLLPPYWLTSAGLAGAVQEFVIIFVSFSVVGGGPRSFLVFFPCFPSNPDVHTGRREKYCPGVENRYVTLSTTFVAKMLCFA